MGSRTRAAVPDGSSTPIIGGPVRRRLAAATAIVLVVFALGGCSFEFSAGFDKEMSKDELERSVADSLERAIGKRPDAIECPSGIAAEVSKSIRCVLTGGQDRFGLTATVTAVDGDNVSLDVQVDNAPMN
jgi:hypothetical protein